MCNANTHDNARLQMNTRSHNELHQPSKTILSAASGGPSWVEFGPNWVDLGPNLGRSRANVGRNWLSSGPNLVVSKPNWRAWVNFAPALEGFGQNPTKSDGLGPTSA